MENIVTISELENSAWPPEFSGAWANIMISIIGNTVFSLYFNSEHPEGTILEDNEYLVYPDAHISIRPNGEIFEIYVKKELRRRGIGAILCAWTRTNFLNKGLIVKAPHFMNDDAKYLYNYLSSVYNEPYEDPEPVPLFDVYLDFGGRAIMELET